MKHLLASLALGMIWAPAHAQTAPTVIPVGQQAAAPAPAATAPAQIVAPGTRPVATAPVAPGPALPTVLPATPQQNLIFTNLSQNDPLIRQAWMSQDPGLRQMLFAQLRAKGGIAALNNPRFRQMLTQRLMVIGNGQAGGLVVANPGVVAIAPQTTVATGDCIPCRVAQLRRELEALELLAARLPQQTQVVGADDLGQEAREALLIARLRALAAQQNNGGYGLGGNFNLIGGGFGGNGYNLIGGNSFFAQPRFVYQPRQYIPMRTFGVSPMIAQRTLPGVMPATGGFVNGGFGNNAFGGFGGVGLPRILPAT